MAAPSGTAANPLSGPAAPATTKVVFSTYLRETAIANVYQGVASIVFIMLLVYMQLAGTAKRNKDELTALLELRDVMTRDVLDQQSEWYGAFELDAAFEKYVESVKEVSELCNKGWARRVILSVENARGIAAVRKNVLDVATANNLVRDNAAHVYVAQYNHVHSHEIFLNEIEPWTLMTVSSELLELERRSSTYEGMAASEVFAKVWSELLTLWSGIFRPCKTWHALVRQAVSMIRDLLAETTPKGVTRRQRLCHRFGGNGRNGVNRYVFCALIASNICIVEGTSWGGFTPDLKCAWMKLPHAVQFAVLIMELWILIGIVWLFIKMDKVVSARLSRAKADWWARRACTVK